MTYRELDSHLLEQLDSEVVDMRQVSWKDLEKLHMLTSVLALLWHPAMKSRMDQTVIALPHREHNVIDNNEAGHLTTTEYNNNSTAEPKKYNLY